MAPRGVTVNKLHSFYCSFCYFPCCDYFYFSATFNACGKDNGDWRMPLGESRQGAGVSGIERVCGMEASELSVIHADPGRKLCQGIGGRLPHLPALYSMSLKITEC